MKKLKLLVLSLTVILSMGFVAEAQAAEPCRVYLCMAGAAQGARNAECTGDYMYYFSFRVYNPNGSFNPELTQQSRRAQLNMCTEKDSTFLEQIQSKYGRQEFDTGM